MAEVFLAKRVGSGGFEKAVAIKRLLPELARDPAGAADFLREAILCSQLSHPNVVQVLDYGTAGGQPYLVMELVDGPDLRRLVNTARKAGEPLTADEALFVVAAVADALGYAWEARGGNGAPLHIVHRDVNPMNVLVSRDGQVKLADFGVARADDREKTQVGLIKGKLGYIAPELATGAEPSNRSDLFLAGAVLWELLSGEPLFRNRANAAQAIGELLAYDDAELPELICDCPEVVPILRKALAKDPAARHEHARQFAEELRTVLAGRGRKISAEHLASRVRKLFPHRSPLEAELRSEGRPLRDDGPRKTAPQRAAAPPPVPAPAAPSPPAARVPVASPPATQAKRQRLGEMLVARGVITASQLQTILLRQRREGGRIGEWAIELDLAPAREVLATLASQLEVPFVTDEKLLAFDPPKELIERFSQETALRLLALPVAFKDGWAYVAMTDPADLVKRDGVGFALGKRFRPVLCTELAMRRAISRAYGRPDQELRWRQLDPSDPHVMLTSRIIDLEAQDARKKAVEGLTFQQLRPQPAPSPALQPPSPMAGGAAQNGTPVTPWPVVYVPAGSDANGEPIFRAIPMSAIGGMGPAVAGPATHAPMASPEAAMEAPTRVVPVPAQPAPVDRQRPNESPTPALPELDSEAVRLVEPG
jgi:serine/threonine-protein kinase